MKLESKLAHRKILAIVLLLVAAWGAYLIIVSPILAANQTYDETLEELVDRLGHYRRIAARAEVIADRLEEVERRRQPTNAYYLADSKQALAAAELQSYLKQTVERSGGQLISSQIVPTRSDDEFAKVAVQVNLRGDTSALRAVLYHLESGNPVVFIDEVAVAVAPQRAVRGRETEGPASLRIQFEATAYGKVGMDGWQE
jgi:general secretion pathway protein M